MNAYPLAFLLPLPLATAQTSQVTPPFQAICVQQRAAGLQWLNGGWVPASFANDNRKILVQKVDIAANEAKPIAQRFHLCKAESKKSQGADYMVVEACYMWREFGTQLNGLDADMCSEFYIEGKLDHVSCNSTIRSQAALTFHPDGNFIQLPSPSSIDISGKPKNDYKDSLAVSVGQCSRFN